MYSGTQATMETPHKHHMQPFHYWTHCHCIDQF